MLEEITALKAKEYQRILIEEEEKGTLVTETFDISQDVYGFIQKEAEIYNVSFNTMVNVLLRDYLILLHIDELKKNDEYKDLEIMDSYTYCENLEKDETFEKKILIVNYFKQEDLCVSLPAKEYEELSELTKQES
jgi:hypothetical protein